MDIPVMMLEIPQQPQHSDDVRIRRIRYRSWHRGCKETDVILGNFADKALHTLNNSDELILYEALLDEQDVDIWNWLTDKTELADGKYDSLKHNLKTFAKMQ